VNRLSIPLATAATHFTLTAAALNLSIVELGRGFPQGSSAFGRVLEIVVGVLGLPLVTPALHTGSLPFFGPAWQPYAVILANSLLWGGAVLSLRESARRGGAPGCSRRLTPAAPERRISPRCPARAARFREWSTGVQISSPSAGSNPSTGSCGYPRWLATTRVPPIS
jgi:hypothetical protein